MLGRRKIVSSLFSHEADRKLIPTLSWPHLVAMGVGAIVGTGIYTLTGVGADRAGPAVILAFAIAGSICACAALAYAELATALPAAGSAYTYSYVALGEVVAWIIGWSLVLEYSVACSAVAAGWSAYVSGLIQAMGVPIPEALLMGPHAGGIVNLPAVLISLAVTALLVVGAKESATVNLVLVGVKLVALAAFVGFTIWYIKPTNFEPFMPYGFAAHSVDGAMKGVMAAAAIVFFAFFGFDAVSTSAEEAKNPGRDLTIGIIGSMALCTVIYMAVAACAVGAWPFQEFAKSGEPLAFVLRSVGHPVVGTLIAAAAIIALPTVILVMMFGQSRVFFVMSRDGLLPRGLSKVHPKFGTPTTITIITGCFVAAVAGFFRLDEIAELSNAGTLAAFVAAAVCMMVMRKTHPDLPRVFRCPLPWVVGPLTIAGCLYLFVSLPPSTMLRFLAWNVVGLIIYYFYGRRHSALAGDQKAA
ncbi:MAG: amino acid permease [Caulobacter sp.]